MYACGMKPIWGIDLGGTKVEGVIVDADDQYRVISRLRHATEKEHGYDHIIHRIGLLIDRLRQESGLEPEQIGIGTPGAIDPTLGTMKNSNTTVLNGRPLKEDLEAHIKLPAIMANDANCFALAETRLGAVQDIAPNAQAVFGVIMGTGAGGGLVVHNKILHGRHGIAGEWGHNFLDASGGECYCGRTGCVERLLAGPASERFYESQAGTFLKLREIYARYQADSDPIATQTIERLLHFFGKGIATIINMIDPDVILLGGGVGNIDVLYTKGVAEVEKYVFNHRLETPIIKPKLGDSAGVFGAAMLVE